MRVDLLFAVNNVGRSHEIPTDFIDTPKIEIHDIIAINVTTTAGITALIAPGMVARQVTHLCLSLCVSWSYLGAAALY